MRAFERQKDGNGIESTQAFEAWCGYRDWGIKRSNARVAEWLGKSEALINRWSSRWDWQGRLQGMNDWQEMIKRDALEAAEREKAYDLVSRSQKLDEEILSLKEALIPRLKQMAQFPLVKTTKTSEDGKEITNVYPSRWTFNTLVNTLGVLKETETGNVNVNVNVNGEEDVGHTAREIREIDQHIAQLRADIEREEAGPRLSGESSE